MRGNEIYQGNTAEQVDVSAADYVPDPFRSFIVRCTGGTGVIKVKTVGGDDFEWRVSAAGPDVLHVPCNRIYTTGTTYDGDIDAYLP
jgi:hypothetical protein